MRRTHTIRPAFGGYGILAALVGLALARSSSKSPPSGTTPTTDAGADTTHPAGFDHEVVLSMSLTVPSGAELHQCQFVQLPAGADLSVVRIAHQYTPGSHHFLLY